MKGDSCYIQATKRGYSRILGESRVKHTARTAIVMLAFGGGRRGKLWVGFDPMGMRFIEEEE